MLNPLVFSSRDDFVQHPASSHDKSRLALLSGRMVIESRSSKVYAS